MGDFHAHGSRKPAQNATAGGKHNRNVQVVLISFEERL